MPALEAGLREFLGAGLTRAVRAGDGGCAPGRAAFHLAEVRQFRAGIGQADKDHPVVHERVDEAHDGALVAAAGAGTGENAAGFSDELAFHPQPAGLIEEVPHLRGHITEAGRRAEEDGVVVAEFLRIGNGRGLIEFGTVFCRHLGRHGFRHALDGDFDAFDGTRAFCDGVGQRFNVAVGGVVEDKDSGHDVLCILVLAEIEKQCLVGLARREGQRPGFLGARGVAGGQRGAIQGQRPLGNVQPGAASRLEFVGHTLAGLEADAIDVRVLVNSRGAVAPVG